jgi:NTP pyrophosphatase (non-canonical NTP hydrolase)
MFRRYSVIYGQPSLFEGQEGKLVEVAAAPGYGLDAQAALIHETAREKGFWPDENYYFGSMEVTNNAIGNKLALIHSEVTEILEAVRKEQGQDKVVEEMADVLIRLLDLWAALKNTGQVTDSLEESVNQKMIKNAGRPMKHGNLF